MALNGRLGRAMARLRELRGIGQRELARRMNVGSGTLARYEGDKRPIPLDFLERWTTELDARAVVMVVTNPDDSRAATADLVSDQAAAAGLELAIAADRMSPGQLGAVLALIRELAAQQGRDPS